MNSEFNTTTQPQVGVADYFDRKTTRPTSRLVELAADVIIIARCDGAPEAAKYFTERFGVKVTERMIKTIKSKVRNRTLIVTRGELEAAAKSHPTSAARLLREPTLCDPQNYRAAITPEPEEGSNTETAKKKAVAKKAATKQAAKKSKEPIKEANQPPPAKVNEAGSIVATTNPISVGIETNPKMFGPRDGGMKLLPADDPELIRRRELLEETKKVVRS